MSYRTILCFLLCLAGISAGAQGSASGSGIAGQESSEEERQFAVTEFSVNYMRIAPDYESALETQELMGTPVEVTERRGYWCRIVSRSHIRHGRPTRDWHLWEKRRLMTISPPRNTL